MSLSLPPGHLTAFPVRYLQGLNVEGVPPAHSNGSNLIAFANTFDEQWVGKGPHNAIDILGAEGLEIVSSTYGQVVHEWFLGGPHPGAGRTTDSGFFVVIVDVAGYFHHYYHMRDAPKVSPSDIVAPGDQLGYLGRTGIARWGPHHLHYQVRGPMSGRQIIETRDGTLRYRGQGDPPYNPFFELERLAVAMRHHNEGRRRVLDPPPPEEPARGAGLHP